MGNPQHFSLELPQRCQQLIQELYPYLPDGTNCGEVPRKLRATFLLSISMPMINLPLERINKFRADDGQAKHLAAEHMNDRPLDMNVANAMQLAIDSKILLKDAPFFSGSWRYLRLPKGEGFPNLAQNGLPQAVADALSVNTSDAGLAISTKLFCDILRNSLAHGGILFLNERGESSREDAVRMFVFVSTDRAANPSALHFLRVGMRDYREFLQQWAGWLSESGLQKGLMEEKFVAEAAE